MKLEMALKIESMINRFKSIRHEKKKLKKCLNCMYRNRDSSYCIVKQRYIIATIWDVAPRFCIYYKKKRG